MEYAVFDWDNTVRAGYTLFSWIDFLLNKGVLSQDLKDRVDKLRESYNNRDISHDVFAEKADVLYCNAMKGITKADYDDLVSEYMDYDKKSIFSFTKSIFRFLSRNDIRIVIISGAPESILTRYRQECDIDMIYAFSESFSEENVCSGEVLYNYGHRKELVIEKLFNLYKKYPLFGFGDSASDYPLFKYSLQAYCIVGEKHEYKVDIPRIKYIDNKTKGKDVELILKKDLLKYLNE